MNYIRSLFLNFLIVFFVDRVIPGIEITYFQQVPNIGADILFSIVVGFLNATIYPFLAILELSITKFKLALFTFLVSFGAFTAISMIPFGIRVVSPAGWIFGGGVVWVMAFVTNYMEWRHDLKRE